MPQLSQTKDELNSWENTYNPFDSLLHGTSRPLGVSTGTAQEHGEDRQNKNNQTEQFHLDVGLWYFTRTNDSFLKPQPPYIRTKMSND